MLLTNLLYIILLLGAEEDSLRTIFIHPTIGSSRINIVEGSVGENYQLIPIDSDRDIAKVNSYLSDIIKYKDMEILPGVTLYKMLSDAIDFKVENKQTYVFISCSSNDVIYEQPYMKPDTNAIFFDPKETEFDSSGFVSIWVFNIPEELNNFDKVIFSDEKGRLEFGRFALVPYRFKKGVMYNKIHNGFKIVGSGEFYEETFKLTNPVDTIEKTMVGFKSYSDTIRMSIGTMFGVSFELMESDIDEEEFTLKFTHPSYKMGPKLGKMEDIQKQRFTVGKRTPISWRFDNRFELIPGKWTFQILKNENVLFEKVFYLILDK